MGLLDKLKAWKQSRDKATLERLLKRYIQRYAASKPNRLNSPITYGWKTDFNALIEQANPTLRERIRSLVRNFPPFVRAINCYLEFVIGKGARFQSLITNSDGKPDKIRRQIIEDRFHRWMDRASVDGRMHFYDCQRLALRQQMETGEYFCSFRSPKDRNRHPLALQFVEADRVEGSYELKPQRSDAVVWQGIEFDAETGERFGYHIRRQSWPQKYEFAWDFFPADKLIHGYDLLRPDQLRGVSVMVSVVLLACMAGDFTEAELGAAQMAAKWLAFVTSPDPKAFQQHRPGKDGAKGSLEPQMLGEIENGTIEYLRTGETISLAAAPDRVKDNFDRFMKFVLRMIGSVKGIPYELLSMDYSGVNYSTARMSRQDYNIALEPERFALEQKFNKPIFREWLRWEALMEPSLFPGYQKEPSHYEKAMWVPAGMPSPDPLKEGKADIDNINAGLDSPQGVMLARGLDPEKVLEELAEWKDLCDEKGVELNTGAISTAYQTNPAALEASDE